MGNLENETIDQNQLAQYLKEGITMNDLINLKIFSKRNIFNNK